MGRPPAFVFVVRHGNRLDAADKQWHLTSPTPYDPPLTYGGWSQAKALGARIGSILREKIHSDEIADAESPDSDARPRRKRYKVVLHSSPFLRCVQTSIAIAAGIAQDPSPLHATSPDGDSPKPKRVLDTRTRPTVITERFRAEETKTSQKPTTLVKSVLRLDAFLGEWLTPSYFELITPPPESVMMLASAKADLLRREDYHSYTHFANPVHVHSSSHGQLWGASSSDGLENMAVMTGALPRSGSMSSQVSRASVARSLTENLGGYVAPLPNYAISSSATIPLGFVSHARDACVDIDYQWDTMREPFEWGDGGSYGEEWTSMHRRFRKGIQHLIDWYSLAANPTAMVTKTARPVAGNGDGVECAIEDEADDEETEAVVIMVSHGAGCNALIGAITHQPVLMEVSMASLTMAVRKPGKDFTRAEMAARAYQTEDTPSPERRTASVPIHRFYDLRLFANTEHLRSAQPLTPSSSRSPSSASIASAAIRGRFASAHGGSPTSPGYFDGYLSRSSSASAALGYGGRKPSSPGVGTWNGVGITVGSGVTSFAGNPRSSSLARSPSWGLWSPTVRTDDGYDDFEDDGMVLNFSHEKMMSALPAAKAATSPTNEDLEEQITPQPSQPTPTANGVITSVVPVTTVDASPIEAFPNFEIGIASASDVAPARPPQLPGLGIDVSNGLWGGSSNSGSLRPASEAERLRELGASKRRWTVNEPAGPMTRDEA